MDPSSWKWSASHLHSMPTPPKGNEDEFGLVLPTPTEYPSTGEY